MTTELGYWTIPVPDVKRGMAFFGALFGWEFADVSDGYAHVSNVTPPMGLAKGAARDLSDHYFRVDDATAVADKVRALGGHTDMPAEYPSGLNIRCTDDQGTVFGLWQPAPGY